MYLKRKFIRFNFLIVLYIQLFNLIFIYFLINLDDRLKFCGVKSWIGEAGGVAGAWPFKISWGNTGTFWDKFSSSVSTNKISSGVLASFEKKVFNSQANTEI